MKKLLVLISLIVLTTSLYAKKPYDVRVVEEYLQISNLLAYGTYIGGGDEQTDAIKYAKKALDWMKSNKMEMNSPLAARTYYQLGAAMGNDAEAKKMVVKSLEIYKKSLGENHPQTKEIELILKDFY